MGAHKTQSKTTKQENMPQEFSFNFDASNNNNATEEQQEVVPVDAKELVEQLIKQLPEEVQPKAKELQTLQDEHDTLESEYEKELLALNLKYEQLYKPIYAKRSQVTVNIPNFWRTALENSDLGYEIQEQDKESLEYLVDVKCESFTGVEKEERPKDGFTLSFHFKENPFFNNSVLSQTFYYEEDGSIIDTIADGTMIEWKSQEKNLTVVKKTVKPKGKKAAQKKATTSWVPVPSFYHFFSNRTADDAEEDEEDEVGGLNGDSEFARYIKEQLIPHAFDFFLGIVPQEIEPGLLGDDFDEEDDEEEEEEAPARKPKKSAAKQQAQQEQPQECKQQ